MYVFMYVYVYVYVYVCMCVCMCVCTCMCTYVCIYVCIYVCMNVCMCVRMYVFMYVWLYVCVYVCMYLCMYVCTFAVLVFATLHVITSRNIMLSGISRHSICCILHRLLFCSVDVPVSTRGNNKKCVSKLQALESRSDSPCRRINTCSCQDARMWDCNTGFENKLSVRLSGNISYFSSPTIETMFKNSDHLT